MDKKQQIVNLWRTCFRGVPRSFISFYFDRVYKDENAMTIEKDGKIVSALQIVPYTMTYLGTRSRWPISPGCARLRKKGVRGLCGNLARDIRGNGTA